MLAHRDSSQLPQILPVHHTQGQKFFQVRWLFCWPLACAGLGYLALTGYQSRTLVSGLLPPASSCSAPWGSCLGTRTAPSWFPPRTRLFHVCSKTASRARMAKKMFVWRDRDKRRGVCGSGDKKVGHLKNSERKGNNVNYAAKLVFPTSHLFGGSLAAWPEAARPLTEPREWRCCLPPGPALRLPTSLHPVRSWGEG